MNPPPSDPQPPQPSNVAVWLVLAAVAAATVAWQVRGPRAGCSILCATLVALAAARAFGPEPGLPGVAVRSRVLDVGGYLVLAVVLGGLAWTTRSLVA